MTRYLGTAIRMTILTAILLGLLYPLAITGISQVVFPGAANGSLVKMNGRVVGSSLIAQDFTAAKYFAIIPAMFMLAFPSLATLNVMRLHSPDSAILSAVIFNAIIIVLLIPLALRGVKFRPIPAAALLRYNLLVYGLGGIIAPFIGIKLIDLLVVALHIKV